MSRRSLRDIFRSICVELPQNEELNGTCRMLFFIDI